MGNVSDVRALLLVDMVDSTKLAEMLGDAQVALLWTAHDRLARDLIPKWRGREIDKTDGMLLLFGTASDALGYAVDYHRALATLGQSISARAGLHVGAVVLRENTKSDVSMGAKPLEVDGIAKGIVARVMSIAAGGQTLVSADAERELRQWSLPLRSHGHWQLKGLSDPIELFELVDQRASLSPPPDTDKAYRVVLRDDLWLPVRTIGHSLPAERDMFVGRQDSLDELARRIDRGARLLSVLGIGGIGKTRFVIRFGWRWLGDFPGGVWFCDVSQARDIDGIYRSIARGLDVQLGKDEPVIQLGHAIARRGRCVIIVDNFEQVVIHAEESLGQWLSVAREARFLVTSREVLGIAGEEVFLLAPLAAQEAVTLFSTRAASSRLLFDPGAQDQAAILQLVRLLDGLPLAIELAAARVRVMSPRVLFQRMGERFRLLASVGGRHDRQATLRAALDWSWDLLATPEKAALAQLSVFDGGFTLAAAEALLDLSAYSDAPWPVDVVHSLVDKSLVRQVGDHRFDLLGTVREYAGEHLRTEGRFSGSGPTTALAVRSRHWRHFAGLEEGDAISDGCVEIDNLVTACRGAMAERDARSAVGALTGAWAALKLCGPFQRAVDLALAVSNVPGLQGTERATVEWVAGNALYMLGDVAAARSRCEAGLTLAREADDKHIEARLLSVLGDLLTTLGELDAAQSSLERSLALANEVQDRLLQCQVLNGLGALSSDQGRIDSARSFYDKGLAIANELGDLRWQGGLLGNLGFLQYAQGQLALACEHYEKALDLAQRTGDRRWEGNTRCNLGLLLHERGRSVEAHAQFDAAHSIAREIGHIRLEFTVLCNLGIVQEACGDLDGAKARYEQAVAAAHELGDRRSEGQFRGYLGLLWARLGHFVDARECLGVGEVLLIEVSDRLGLGLNLCSRAQAEQLAGDIGAAATALQRAQAVADELNADRESELGRAIEQARRAIR